MSSPERRLALLAGALIAALMFFLVFTAHAQETPKAPVSYFELVQASDYPGDSKYAVQPYLNLWVKRDPDCDAYILEVGGPAIVPLQQTLTAGPTKRDYKGWLQYHVDLALIGTATGTTLTLVSLTPLGRRADPAYGPRTILR